MENVYSNVDLGFSVVRLPFSDWLAVPEPDFFGDSGENGFSVQHLPSLYNFSTTVVLLKVGDSLFKMNGYSRKEGWLNGSCLAPNEVTALVYNVSEPDFLMLCVDARAKRIASLPPNEVVKDIYARLRLEFKSDRLRHGYITEAIHISLRGRPRNLQSRRLARDRYDIDMRKAIEIFTNELLLIDSLSPKPDIFLTGVLAGSLIMLGLNKPITKFLQLLNDKQGETKDGLSDPVTCLLKVIHRHKISHRVIQPKMSIDLAKKTVHAIAIWLEGEQSPKYWRMRDLIGHELVPLITEMKQLKMINAERDL